MKGVTHDRVLQWEQWCPCGWQLNLLGACVPVDTSIQVWRPVVESAWHEHSSLPGCQYHAHWLSLPGPVWFKHSSSPRWSASHRVALSTWPSMVQALLLAKVVRLTPGGSLYLAQSGSSTPPRQGGQTHTRWLSLTSPVWLKHSSSPRWSDSHRVTLSTWPSMAQALLLAKVVRLTPGGSLYLAQYGTSTPPRQGGQTHTGWLSLPGPVWLKHSSSPRWSDSHRVALSTWPSMVQALLLAKVVRLTPGGSLYLAQYGSSTPPRQGGQTHTGWLSLPGPVWFKHSSSPRWSDSHRVALSTWPSMVQALLLAKVVRLTPGGSLYLAQYGSSTPPRQGGQTHTGWLFLPGPVWLKHSSSPRWSTSHRVALFTWPSLVDIRNC